MSQLKTNIIIAALLVFFAATLKVVTFPLSFNPIIAIAFFSGAVIKDRKFSFAMPLLAMFVSDVMMEVLNIAPGFYGLGQIGNYLSLLMVTILGFAMKKPSALSIGSFSVMSSLLFFVLSNTNCFLFDNSGFYGSGMQGWLNCLAAGVPFVKNGLFTDLFFSTVLFTSYYLVTVAKSRKSLAN
jgi:hypothetical protein